MMRVTNSSLFQALCVSVFELPLLKLEILLKNKRDFKQPALDAIVLQL